MQCSGWNRTQNLVKVRGVSKKKEININYTYVHTQIMVVLVKQADI